jgi:hypothetical protein
MQNDTAPLANDLAISYKVKHNPHSYMSKEMEIYIYITNCKKNIKFSSLTEETGNKTNVLKNIMLNKRSQIQKRV